MGSSNFQCRLHHGGKYSDLKVICNDRQWSVHKAIVCSRSGFFDGACSHRFRESETGVIDLSEDDEEAVEQMIHCTSCKVSRRQSATDIALPDLYHLDYLNEQLENQASVMFRHRAYSDARRKLPSKIDFTKIEDPLLSQAGLYNTPVLASPVVLPQGEARSTPDKQQSSPTASRSNTPPLEADDGSDDEGFETTESESHLILHTQVSATLDC